MSDSRTVFVVRLHRAQNTKLIAALGETISNFSQLGFILPIKIPHENLGPVKPPTKR